MSSLFDEDHGEKSLFHLGMEEPVRLELLDAARWARFLAIMGFIFIGMLMALGIYLVVTLINLYSAQMGPNWISGFLWFVGLYFLLGIIYVYPSYALLQFGNYMKPALQSADQERFNRALLFLRNMFKYLGILSIILLASCGLLLAVLGLSS